MKKLSLVFLSLFLLCFFSCTAPAPQDNSSAPEPALNEATETAAIMKVLDAETKCFYERNYDCWQKNWVQADHAMLSWSNSDGTVSSRKGWEQVNAEIKSYIKNNPLADGEESTHPDVQRKNVVAKFYGNDAAYIFYDQFNGSAAGTYTMSTEVRVMEKVEGEWKIANVSAFWNYGKEWTAEEI